MTARERQISDMVSLIREEARVQAKSALRLLEIARRNGRLNVGAAEMTAFLSDPIVAGEHLDLTAAKINQSLTALGNVQATIETQANLDGIYGVI